MSGAVVEHDVGTPDEVGALRRVWPQIANAGDPLEAHPLACCHSQRPEARHRMSNGVLSVDVFQALAVAATGKKVV